MEKGIKVLYVDDEPGLLELGKLFLEQSGQFTVDIQTSAQDGFARLKAQSYDAIISDYQMPEMDGIAFLRRVRSSDKSIPFILFTGRGREEVVIQAINNGADFYLQKGGDPTAQFAELAHKILQAVGMRRAELLRSESEKRLADIINFLPDATFAIDRTGHVIAWNRAIEEMTGVPAAEIMGKGDNEYAIPFYGSRRKILIDLIFEPDDVIAKNYAHIIHENDTLIADTSLPRPKGTSVTLMGKASPLYDRKGEVVGAIESIRDITERKLAEDALRESEERLISIFSAAQVGIILVDAATHRILQANAKALELFGAPEQDVVGRVCHTFICPAEAGTCPVTDLYEDVDSSERVLLTWDGRRIPVLKTVVRQRIGGQDVLIESFVDITDRKRMEEALAESERRYRGVVESQTEFICRFLPDGTHVFVNDAYCTYFGKNRNEIIGHRFRPEIPAEDRDGVRRHFASLTRDHPVAETEHRIRLPDGMIRWQWWSDHAIFDESGRLVEYQAIGRDITDRRRAEEALAESEANLLAIITNTSDIIASYDRDIRLIAFNRSCSEVYRTLFGVEIYPGLCTLDLFPESQRGFWTKNNERALGGESFTIEFQLPTPDGSLRSFESSFNPIRENSDIVGFSTMTRDITDRRRTEEELRAAYERITASEEQLQVRFRELAQSEQRVRESERKYRELAELLPQIVFETDRNFTITFVNRQTYTALGYSPEEIASGFDTLSIIDPAQHRRLKENVRKMVAGEPFGQTEYTFRRKDGSTFPGLIYADPVFRNGDLTGFRGIIIDITDRKKTEEALVESEDRFSRAIAGTGAGLWDWDMVSDRVFFSPQWKMMLGYMDHEVENNFTGWKNLWHPDDAARIGKAVNDYLEGKTTKYEIEHRLRHKDGSWHWILTRGDIHRDAAGKPVRWTGTNIDVTDRRRAEEALHEREATLASIFRAAPTGIGMVINRVIMKVNDRLCAMTGYKGEELLGKSARVLYPSDEDYEYVGREKYEQIRKYGTGTVETRWQRKDGTILYVLLSSTPLDPADHGKGVTFTALDITGRKRQERIQKEQLELGLALQKIHGLTETLDTCLSSAIRVSDMDAGAIYLADPVTGSFDLVVAQNLSSGFTSSVSHFPADSVNARMLMAGKPVYIPFGTSGIAHTPEQEREGLRVAAFIPITSGGRVVAGLYLVSRILEEIPITARIAAEMIATQIGAALERILSEEALRLKDRAITSSINAIVIADMGGRITYVNDSFTRMWGYTAQESSGMEVTSLGSSDEEVEKFVTQFRSQGYAVGESIAKRKDGSSFAIQVSGSLVVDESGQPKAMLSSFVDITERKQAEDSLRRAYEQITASEEELRSQYEELAATQEELQKQQQQLAEVANMVPGVVYQFYARPDGTRGLYYISSRASDIFGFPHDAGDFYAWFTAHVDPRDRDAFLRSNDAVIASVSPWNFEGRFIRPSGAPIWFQGMSRPVRRGAELVFNGILIDITDRKQAELAIRENEQKYRTVVEQSNDAIFIAQDGILVFHNPAFSAMTGYSDAELAGRPIADLIAPEDRDLVLIRHRERLGGKSLPETYEFSVLHHDGTTRIRVVMNVSPATIGGHPATIGTLHDVTRERRQEAALRESENRYRSVIENLHTAVVVHNPDTSIRLINTTALDLLGLTRDEAIGRVAPHPSWHFSREDGSVLPLAEFPVNQVITTQKPLRNMLTGIFRPRSQDTLWVLVSADPEFDENGSLTAILVTFTNITDRKRAEEALLQVNRKLNLLSGITRHDIKNQLLSLNGILEISKKYAGDAAKMAEFIAKEGKVVKTMERQIAFTKEYEAIGVNAPVWQGCRTLVDTAAKQVLPGAILVKNDLPAGLVVFADPLIVKVCHNLMDNAVRHGGTITTLRFFGEERGGDLIVVCEDDGVGVPAEEKELIFERGFGKNTGMGLFLAREILSITGITITEKGEPGRGARFEITMPNGAWRVTGKE